MAFAFITLWLRPDFPGFLAPVSIINPLSKRARYLAVTDEYGISGKRSLISSLMQPDSPNLAMASYTIASSLVESTADAASLLVSGSFERASFFAGVPKLNSG